MDLDVILLFALLRLMISDSLRQSTSTLCRRCFTCCSNHIPTFILSDLLPTASLHQCQYSPSIYVHAVNVNVTTLILTLTLPYLLTPPPKCNWTKQEIGLMPSKAGRTVQHPLPSEFGLIPLSLTLTLTITIRKNPKENTYLTT